MAMAKKSAPRSEAAPSEPGTVKRKDEFIAIKTAPNVTAGPWFAFHPANGGSYTSDDLDDPDNGWK